MVSVVPSPQSQVNVKSSLPGSVAVPFSETSAFSSTAAVAKGAIVGATLFTVTVVVAVLAPPSSSITVSVTVYRPLSPYVWLAVSVRSMGLTSGLGYGSAATPSL